MSDMGLYSSIYEQLRFYADKVDYALANLKSNDQALADAARREIASLLKELAKGNIESPSIRLMAMVLRQQLPPDFVDKPRALRELGDVLDERMPNQTELERLEQIAFAIDRECSRTGQRLRGSL